MSTCSEFHARAAPHASTRTARRLAAGLGSALVVLCAERVAAGGYDTPILYSARHMGMGGAAVSYVSDPSALFHNPAGLAPAHKASVLVDVSPLIGTLRASPLASVAEDVDSERSLAPFFLIGGAYRLTDSVVLGLAVFPVAGAGGEYVYDVGNTRFKDKTQVMFIETTPGLSIELPAGLRLGASYRLTYVSLERFQGSSAAAATDFTMSGFNFLGFRLGAQWTYERLSIGIDYRTKMATKIENDHGHAFGWEFDDIHTELTLPSRLVFGARYDFDDLDLPLGVAFDVEYGFNSENQRSTLQGTCADRADTSCRAIEQTGAPQVFRWRNAWTLRPGLEYRLLDGRIPLRVGYIWDQRTANPIYPTAFGTPPGNGHVVTLGVGYRGSFWQVNSAYAYRTVKGDVTQDDAAARSEPCPFCGGVSAKGYQLRMHGIYLDTSFDF